MTGEAATKRLADAVTIAMTAPDGKKIVAILEDYPVSQWGEILCASCNHGHTEGAWSESDPDDGTCWNASSLVCGCPKFITPSVKRMRAARLAKGPTHA